jgi:hypothetical protein
MTTTGLPILHSRDLVNWRIIAYAFERLDLGRIAFGQHDRVELAGKQALRPCVGFVVLGKVNFFDGRRGERHTVMAADQFLHLTGAARFEREHLMPSEIVPLVAH